MKPGFVKRGLIWSGAVLVALVLLVLGAVSWVLFTTPGARFVAAQATQRMPQVKYATLDGTLAGELIITDFDFAGAPDAARIHIARLTVNPTLRMLLSRELRIEHASVQGLVLTLPPVKDEPGPDEPMWVKPPLAVVVRDFALVDGVIRREGAVLVRLRQLGVAARWSAEELLIERLTLLPGDIEGTLNVTGRIVPAGDLVSGDIDARWEDVRIPASLAGLELASQGALSFDGTPDKYTANGKFDLGPPGDPTHVLLALAGTDLGAQIRQLELRQRAGELHVTGTVEFEPVAWELSAKAHDFNPGAFLANWNGSVNLDLATRGQMSEAGPGGTLRIASLSGVLRGRPISGGGNLELIAPSRLSGDLRLKSGRSQIEVRGQSAGENQIDARVALVIASLNDWVPDTAGSLSGDFRVRGVWPKLTVAGTAEGKSLAYGEHRAAGLKLSATVDNPLDPEGRLELGASKVTVAGLEFATVKVSGSGNQGAHQLALDADGEKLDIATRLRGGMTARGWRGELQKLGLAAPDIANLELRAPANVVFESGAFELSQACMVDGDIELCGAADLDAAGALQASYSFRSVPLGLANALAPDAMPGQLRGHVAGSGKMRRTADGQWFGDARITSPEARLVMQDDEAGANALGRQTWVLYENLDLHAQLEGETANLQLAAALMEGGKIDATMNLMSLTAEAPGLRGRINAAMPTLAPFAAFVPGIANLDGAVNANLDVGGTVAAPTITGNVDATKLQADLGQLGIQLRDGRVEGEARPGGGFALTGSVASGKGHVEFDGSMSAQGAVDVKITGQNFLAANIPAANVIVTPDLTLSGNPEGYLLSGEVTIPRADINLQKLPQDQAPGVSPDVVVVRNGKEVTASTEGSKLPLRATITVKLGEHIAVTGYGLEATVAGQLVVREAPGAPTTGSGQLTVAGRYKAYGQDLTIREGRLLFAGTPLDDPRLSIVAMRAINDDLETGLRITGSAQRPLLTVISDPNVGEADALSYLVTGRSLSDVGSASGSSQDALASATRSLEGAGAGLIAKRIGKRLGLDEAGVEENEMIGGSALTIGEYLSPRLYLSYGVGLFEPGEVVALRYKLSKGVGVRVQRGTEETRAGVEYRIER